MSKGENMKKVIYALIILALLLFGYIYIKNASNQVERDILENLNENAPEPNSPSTYRVVYHITGTAWDADATYTNATGGTEQKRILAPQPDKFDGRPWELSFQAEAGDFVYISVQNNRDTGKIKCEIFVDNTVLVSAESNVDYGVATCDGTVGD